MTHTRSLLRTLWSLTLSLARSLRIAHPNRLPVAPFYGMSRVTAVELPKRIPTSRVRQRRAQ
jgi:hypothetical protein